MVTHDNHMRLCRKRMQANFEISHQLPVGDSCFQLRKAAGKHDAACVASSYISCARFTTDRRGLLNTGQHTSLPRTQQRPARPAAS
jgi:hypothetical protein